MKKRKLIFVLSNASGSQGDVQPFIVVAKGLLRAGHSVRMATHAPFKDFIEKNEPKIEFFDLGGLYFLYQLYEKNSFITGNPEEMMKFVVNHPKVFSSPNHFFSLFFFPSPQN
jgi:UDP:flavonoid glycosyltransferase YjiC (YdhE family)